MIRQNGITYKTSRIMSIITERRKMYARVLTENGVDLSKPYFAQPMSKLDIIRLWCEVFKFKSSNPSRTDAQQFYYSAQTGAAYLNK